MKTSNKLLLAFFVATMLFIAWIIGTAKYYENKGSFKGLDKDKASKEQLELL